jgi:Uma2 family endonuclease
MLSPMKTVVLGKPPPALASLLAERQRLGLDRHDEVWNGEYHMAPAASFRHSRSNGLLFRLLDEAAAPLGLVASMEFNLGEPQNVRVPDLGVHRGDPEGVWLSTAAIVVEVRSPHDESFEKFAFYFDHGVEEILIADLTTETVSWFVRSDGGFTAAGASDVLALSIDDVASALGWLIT